MEIVILIVVYIIGVITGLYASSQIEKDIDHRIDKDE